MRSTWMLHRSASSLGLSQAAEADPALVGELLDLVAAGVVHPVEPVARPLEDAAAVLTDLQARRITGKAVLTP